MELSEKTGKVIFQVTPNLALFCNLVALILSWNCVKSFTVTKIVPKINFEGAWRRLVAENCFQRQSWTKYIGQTLVLT